MNGKIYTGKSGDGSDMTEFGGVHTNPENPEEWSNMPFPPSKKQRMAFEIYDHITSNNRSLKDEYELVQQKKSTLSRRLREFVIELVEKYEEEKQ
tara:strand:+ start:884 stop:1168 length:285 start_codon:yes stop_codon:yes gene_type:complete